MLMPGDLLRDWIANQRIDFRFLGDIAQRFQVSLEALCIRYIKFTTERAILVYWDNGYMKYEWRSGSARTDAGAHPPQRRAGGTHAGHAGCRRQHRARVGRHGDVCRDLVPGRSATHETTRVQAHLRRA
jgi:hypothetical protein